MRDHIRLLGILNIIWSSFNLAIGLVILLVFGGLAGFFSILGIGSDNGANGLIAAPFMAVIGLLVVLVICIEALPALIAGIGLLKRKSWSRILTIIVSIFHLLSFPFGTALGVYGLWVLFQDDARRLLDPGLAAPPDSPIVPV